MSKSQAFFFCARCGNVAALAVAKGGALACCGEAMREIAPNTVEASREKHVPVVEKTADGIRVKVGAAPHPMQEDHRIDFIYVKTGRGGQRASLAPGDAPEAEFRFAAGDEPVEVFAYCNLHGMWKAEA